MGTEPDWNLALVAIAQIPSGTRAAKAVGVSRAALYARLSKHAAFKVAWENALEGGVDDLVQTAWLVARGAWKPPRDESMPKVQEKDGQWRHPYADVDPPHAKMIQYLLRHHRPEVYGLSIKVTSATNIAELRAMSDAEFAELRRKRLGEE